MKTRDRFPALHLRAAHFIAAVAVAMLILARPVLMRDVERPVGDAPRYIVSALALHDHGLFSGPASKTPAQRFELVEGGPLVAFELATIFALSADIEASMRCAVEQKLASCPLNMRALHIAHWLELAIFCACSWLAAWLIFRRLDAAWLTLLAVAFCRELRDGTAQALTEPLVFAVSGLFFLGWIYAWRERRWHSWLRAGLALGLLILAKPSAMAIIPTTLALQLAVMLATRGDEDSRPRNAAGHALAFVAGVAAITLPLMTRNLVELGVFALSSPSYFVTTFAHRIAFNAMSWSEWFAGWLYYLPDFGDGLARKWLPAAAYDRLGWGPNSYYVYGRDVLHRQAEAIAGKQASDYLIREYVLAEPIKHAAVTLLMAWRGMFVGKLWGLVAWLVLPAALIYAKPQRMILLSLLAPPLVLLFGQAALSVSIPRYNGLMILPLAIGLVALVLTGWDKWAPARLRQSA